MMIGVKIITGPKNWQIIQQKNGFADITIEAACTPAREGAGMDVYARVVLENSGQAIIGWQKCTQKQDKYYTILKDIPAGGLYKIETACLTQGSCDFDWMTRGDIIYHVGVGDIYVIAGQSNAAGYGREPVVDPPTPGVHVLRHNGNWDMAMHPLGDNRENTKANFEEGRLEHSPYLCFARELMQTIGYPIGLIAMAQGGSPLHHWNPEEDGRLYHDMIGTVKQATDSLCGMLWYQGCSDAALPVCDTYLDRFTAFAEHARRDLGEITILTCQINRTTNPDVLEDTDSWTTVREAQRMAAEQIPYVFVVPTIDQTVLSDPIHNSAQGNMEIGHRLYRSALQNIYGYPVQGNAPSVQCVTWGNNEIVAAFANVAGQIIIRCNLPLQMPFYAHDSAGEIPIKDIRAHEDKLYFKTTRPPQDGAILEFAGGMNPDPYFPMDTMTRLPMLAFRVGIKHDTD